MKRILITGASGNVGFEVIKHLQGNNDVEVVAGVRNVEKARQLFKDQKNLKFVPFDFEDASSYDKAFEGIQTIFILRPPHISDVDRVFAPMIRKMADRKIAQVVFLSVQGAEKSKIIPHNKIEKLICNSGLKYVFLRPSYFMQNLTTTLLPDIQKMHAIILPSGKAKFNWIDVENIGEAASEVMLNFEKYENRAIELTGTENKNFYEAVDILNGSVKKKITFYNVSPITFYRLKRSQGMMMPGMIIVMIMLHFLPRFGKAPSITDNYKLLTGKKPTTLKDFAEREKSSLDQ